MTLAESIADDLTDGVTDELVSSARALVPMLRANAERAERERRLPEANLNALRAAGLLRLSLPRRHGGYELGVRSFLQVCAELGRGCGSTAWVATLMNTNLYTASAFPDRARAEIFDGNPDAVLSGVILGSGVSIERVDDGYLVSGQWGFATGCLHADWAVLGRTPEKTGDSHAALLVPMQDLRVRDTWNVVGMAGTGSNTLVAEQVFVPEHRAVVLSRSSTDEVFSSAADPCGWQDQAVRRAVLVLGIAAPLLGLARHAYELVTDSLNNGRRIAYSEYRDARNSARIQLALGRAAHLIDSSWMHALRSADDLDRAESTRSSLDEFIQMRIRTDTGVVARECRAAVEILLDVNGAGSFSCDNPLQRVWRDLEVASRHGIINPLMADEGMGRLVAGVAPQSAGSGQR
ncbi:oxidoreductase [Rhodococcus ruber BKS 20-38]|uniref:Oxidoreductase n=1 Tax=Rhodococcus ruber BKS 20-38 TaxID=1278076 RepID=M2ZTX2_9NOCA|nr:acyl-CoA dehydrogenase family protein [Rhodococcus ruber]EME64203.1 oxidoreductase [Rhodococcus ruber BKS 20-38]